jgi:2,3-dihydroxy-p-cumate/2,3-dihydroxybenzoate 3,4-dioxygenase
MPHYHKLGYLALNATDPERTALFYEQQVGLMRVPTKRHDLKMLRCSADHHSIVLCQADSPGLKRIAFEMRDEAALDELAERLRGKGLDVVEVEPAECVDLRIGRAIRITEPLTGATLEFYDYMRNFGGQPFAPTVAKIQRLGHVVIKAERWQEAVDFYRDVLGFSTSDIVDGRVCFMRCTPNPYHHSIGIGAGKSNGLHHVNFMVSEIDDIGRALYRFKRNEVDIVAGPGRHPPSDSIFLYFLDPDNLTVEYSFGMEEFPAEGPRKHRVLPPTEESIDYWGGERDPRHGQTGTIERLDRNS